LGTDIDVRIESGVSTADDIRLALGLDPVAPTIIDVLATGTGLEPQVIQSQLFFVGGVNAIGDAGNEVVNVLGQAIQVTLESGVSNATQVKGAIEGTPAAVGLISTVISGSPSGFQTAPVSPTNLVNGTDNLGNPGSEIVSVDLGAQLIQVTFVNGQSTAQQIKTAIDASAAALNLISVTIDGGQSGTFQNSPTIRLFLTGGRESGTWSINVKEITDPSAFFEGNGDFLINNLNAQRDILVRRDAKIQRNLILDDNTGGAPSGDPVVNAQQTINDLLSKDQDIVLKQFQDRNISLKKGGDWLWTLAGPQITFTADAFIQIPGLNLDRNRILLAQSPITLANDGDVAFVDIVRTAGAANNLTVTVAAINTLALNENRFIRAARVGSKVILAHETLLNDGKAVEIGEGGTTEGGGRGVPNEPVDGFKIAQFDGFDDVFTGPDNQKA